MMQDFPPKNDKSFNRKTINGEDFFDVLKAKTSPFKKHRLHFNFRIEDQYRKQDGTWAEKKLIISHRKY